MRIAVLGAGAFGTALGNILVKNGHKVVYYDPKIIDVQLEDVLDGAEVMVLAVPSGVVQDILSYLPTDKTLIVATKGVLTPEPFEKFENWIVLSGPGFAGDIEKGKSTKLTATSKEIINLFSTDYLKFDSTTDKKGVLMCGALKNTYAILAGILDLKPGTGEHEKFLKDVTKEMGLILEMNGADAKTVNLACGEGDLRITCYYPSRNYEFGQILRDNPEAIPEKTVEGVPALKRIKEGEILVPENAVILRDLIGRREQWA